MARDKALVVPLEIRVTAEQMQSIAASVPGDDSEGRKVQAAVTGIIDQMLEGALLIPPKMVRQMQHSVGGVITEEVVLKHFEAGAGREDGILVVKFKPDPVDEGPIREMSRHNGMEPQEYLQRLWNEAWAQGWFHSIALPVHSVRMTDADYLALKAVIGKDFDNGTQLAALVKEHLESSNIFAGVGE